MTAIGADAAVLGLTLGLLFALVCYLITNLSPGGMITPGWLALLIIEAPIRLVLLSVVIVLSFFVMQLVRKVVILYGKRLFATVVMVAVFLQFTFFVLISNQTDLVDENRTLGFIIPGLITYQLIRQPIVATLLSITAVTALSYGVILGGVLLFLVPGGASPSGLVLPGGGVIDAGMQAIMIIVGSLMVALLGFAATLKSVNRTKARPMSGMDLELEEPTHGGMADTAISRAPASVDDALLDLLSQRAVRGAGFFDIDQLSKETGTDANGLASALARLGIAGKVAVEAERGVPGSFFYRYEIAGPGA